MEPYLLSLMIPELQDLQILRKPEFTSRIVLTNVLRGDMAVVGPFRAASSCKRNCELMPFMGTRHIIKPGLTG
jgi:lipopolysaccharide/colanic/teichoic acid biosynthesis glycosyltransferase